MFWSGNYIAVRELNFLLKEENVTLTQVLEADDILQECKADNKALMQFLTKPKILAELITLITEEPPKNVELASQYRHASIACEVLTSHLSTLSDRLSMDVVQMNRLCDFIDRDPPLNPLLASYFSKTVEMLLERSPKQDWYLYHVVCLRVLDFFKTRRDFLPNLLRHISTSAIADTFKYFIRLDDLFNKIIMEWFEEHQFLECLIQIICGTYAPEEPGAPEPPGAPDAGGKAEPERSPDRPEKGQLEPSEKHPQENTTDVPEKESEMTETKDTCRAEAGGGGGGPAGGAEAEAEAERERRVQAVASANAAALLCDLILSGCAGEGCNTRPRTSWALVSRLQSAAGVRLVLQGVFTAPPGARAHALVNGAHVLRALLDQEPILGGECESERTSVELAVAPHLPLLHQALLEAPAALPLLHAPQLQHAPARVGLPRVQVAALLAHLALSEVEEVASTMLTLGTPGVVVDMLFAYPHNNFLHAQAYALVKHALNNKVYRTQYARHLLVECDLLTRLMDVYEENENKKSGEPRSAYMGHVVLMLRRISKALEDSCVQLDEGVAARWERFRTQTLAAVLHRHDTPLGGYYPSENIYEFIDVTATASLDDVPSELGADAYNVMCTANDSSDFLADELDLEDVDKAEASKNSFLGLASQRFDDDMWEDSPEADGEDEGEDQDEGEGGGGGGGGGGAEADELSVRRLLEQHSPWESSRAAEDAPPAAGAGWAQFEAFAPDTGTDAGPTAGGAASDPFAPAAPQPAAGDDLFAAFWPYSDASDPKETSSQQELEANVRGLSLTGDLQKMDDACSVELANKLLTAMSGMAPEDVARIVCSVPLTAARAGAPGDSPPEHGLNQDKDVSDADVQRNQSIPENIIQNQSNQSSSQVDIQNGETKESSPVKDVKQSEGGDLGDGEPPAGVSAAATSHEAPAEAPAAPAEPDVSTEQVQDTES